MLRYNVEPYANTLYTTAMMYGKFRSRPSVKAISARETKTAVFHLKAALALIAYYIAL